MSSGPYSKLELHDPLHPGLHALYSLHLSVGKACEFNGIVSPMIRLHYVRLYHSRQGRHSPAGFEDISHHVVRGPCG